MKLPEGMINVFGHIHHNNVFDNSRQINVSVEKTDYRPVNIKDLRNNKLFKPE